MDAGTSTLDREEIQLSRDQQAEIGDIFLSARTVSRQMVTQAREQSDEILKTARDRAEQIVEAAQEKADAILKEAQEKADAIVKEAENTPSQTMTQEMQDYVVKCVGDCFARLRQQQLDAAESINAQWQSFLSGLSLPDAEPPAPPPAENTEGEVSRQEIEDRVSAIARELMEIIGK